MAAPRILEENTAGGVSLAFPSKKRKEKVSYIF